MKEDWATSKVKLTNLAHVSHERAIVDLQKQIFGNGAEKEKTPAEDYL
jgi:hypothetical protein